MERNFNPNIRMFDKDGNMLFGFWRWEQENPVSYTAEMDLQEDEE